MAIVCHIGRIGSGKTYGTIDCVIGSYFVTGAVVVTNIAFKEDALRQLLLDRFSYELQPGQLVYCDDWDKLRMASRLCPPGRPGQFNAIVIDEAHCGFNTREVRENWAVSKEFFIFASQSRHACIDLHFISQSMNNVDAQLRRLFTQIIVYYNFKGQKKWGFTLPFPIMSRTVIDPTDMKPVGPPRLVLQDKRIFAVYSTHQVVADFKLAQDVRIGSGVRADLVRKRRRVMYQVGIVVVLAIAFAWWRLTLPEKPPPPVYVYVTNTVQAATAQQEKPRPRVRVSAILEDGRGVRAGCYTAAGDVLWLRPGDMIDGRKLVKVDAARGVVVFQEGAQVSVERIGGA